MTTDSSDGADDRTRSWTQSDQMDVEARTWSWTVFLKRETPRGQSSPAEGAEQVEPPGNQRKE